MKISVCLASYNGSSHIEAQLRSVLVQLSPEDEVVIADDGSTDQTVSIVAAVGDPRIRIVATKGGMGVVKNFERAIAASRGDFVFLCDQDDIWLPGKVDKCVAALRTHLLVVTDCKVVDGQVKEMSPSFFRLRNSGAGLLHNLWKNSYLGCCMAFRRELLDYALPFPKGIPMHDMWLGMIGETRGKVLFLASPLLLYRRHGSNASVASEKSSASLRKMLSQRMVLGGLVLCRAIVNMFTPAKIGIRRLP